MPLVPNNGDGVAIPQTNKVVISTSINIYIGNQQLGLCQSLRPQFSRPTEDVHHLDSVDAGRIVEQAPRPETYRITMTGYTIYADKAPDTGSVLERVLSATPQDKAGTLARRVFRCLSSQSVPFDVVEEIRRPGFDAVVGRTAYKATWLTDHSKPIAINTAMIIEEVQGKPTFVL